MNTRPLLIALRALSLACAPLAGSAADAAVAAAPRLTLVRLELQPFDRPTPAMEATETCVARVKAGEFAAAARPCDIAISAAERERAESRAAPFAGRGSDDGVAVAYNNRAVLRYLSGRLELAVLDASRARLSARSPAIDSTAAVIDAARQRGAASGE